MTARIYAWDGWSFNQTEWRLTDPSGTPVLLPNRALELLALLLDRAPALVTKDEIFSAVWHGAAVEEGNIAFHVASLRKALDSGTTSYIETVRGKGYRFVEPVTRTVVEVASHDASTSEAGVPPPEVDRALPSPHWPHWPRWAVALAIIVIALVTVGGTLWLGTPRGRSSAAESTSAASDLALQAHEYWKQRTPHGIQQAIALYERAIALDPDFARAYAGLADCYNLTMSGMSPAVRYPLAREYAEKAVALDPNGAPGWTSLAFMRYKFEWRFADAEAAFARAIALDPTYAQAFHWYGEFLGVLGRPTDGIPHLRRALALEPTSQAIKSDLIAPLLRTGRLAEARTVLEASAATNPNWHYVPYRMAQLYMAEGRVREAVESQWRWMILTGATLESVDRLRRAYDTGGLEGMTREEIAGYLEVEAATPGAWLNATNLSRAYSRLGDRAEALHWLAVAIDRREDAAISLWSNPDYEPLYNEPEFERLRKLVGLPPRPDDPTAPLLDR